jgi:hypothetical protein
MPEGVSFDNSQRPAIEELKRRIILDRLANNSPMWYGNLEAVSGYLTSIDYADIEERVCKARKIIDGDA